MDTLESVLLAHDAYMDDPTPEAAATFLNAARAYIEAGNTLTGHPDQLYRLMTTQPLPPVTITAPSAWLVVGIATAIAFILYEPKSRIW